MTKALDSVTKAILETIHGAGIAVSATQNQVFATDNKTGERYIIRFDDPTMIDDAVIRLAEQTGIDLMDG